ncbi:MAG: hemolysin family protein [Bacillota bacterium]
MVLSLLFNVGLLLILPRVVKAGKNVEVSEEKIRALTEEGEEVGAVGEHSSEVIGNIFDLHKRAIGDIATHRTNIVALEKDATYDEIVELILKEKYSRIVVYSENIDNIIGILHVKDFVKYLVLDESERKEFSLEDLLMEPFFVPFSKKSNHLFRQMQNMKVHMAIVIDEYGGTEGIVTMEDMFEEIVGNIFDEYDGEEEEEIMKLADGSYRLSGSSYIQKVEEALEISFSDNEDYDTLGGYLVGRLGRIPEEDEKIEIHVGNWLFHVEKIEEKRIEKILVLPVEFQEEELKEEV